MICGEIEKILNFYLIMQKLLARAILGKIKLISQIYILWGLIPGKTASRFNDFCFHPHLKIKIAM